MLKHLALGLCALVITACGYKPLYQQQASALRDVSIGEIRLNDIELNVGERRMAQLLRQELALVLPRTGGTYQLNVVVDEKSSSLAQRRDATDVRRKLALKGVVSLQNAAGDEVWGKTLSANAAYNVEDSPFGTDAGRDYARTTVAHNMAQEIIHELARAFKTNAVEAK
jgi:hypothetical protein